MGGPGSGPHKGAGASIDHAPTKAALEKKSNVANNASFIAHANETNQWGGPAASAETKGRAHRAAEEAHLDAAEHHGAAALHGTSGPQRAAATTQMNAHLAKAAEHGSKAAVFEKQASAGRPYAGPKVTDQAGMDRAQNYDLHHGDGAHEAKYGK